LKSRKAKAVAAIKYTCKFIRNQNKPLLTTDSNFSRQEQLSLFLKILLSVLIGDLGEVQELMKAPLQKKVILKMTLEQAEHQVLTRKVCNTKRV